MAAGLLDPTVVDSVSATNFKVVADGPAFYTGLAMGNAVSHQNRLNQLAETALAASVKMILSVTPEQSVADQKILSGNDLASQLAALLAALGAGQQASKVAQTTPPVSAPGPVVG